MHHQDDSGSNFPTYEGASSATRAHHAHQRLQAGSRTTAQQIRAEDAAEQDDLDNDKHHQHRARSKHLPRRNARPEPGEHRKGRVERNPRHRLNQHPALARLLPECLYRDEATQTLVVRAAGEAYRPEPAAAAAFGVDLAALHRATEANLHLPMRRPWILDVLEPHGFQNPATGALIPDRSAVAARLRLLGAALETTCLVHNDLKFDNCVQQDRVRLIDWEIAGSGDPAWDVAGIVQDHLKLALQGAGGQEALAAFLRAYLDHYAPSDPRAFRMRLSGLAAVRLLQSAHEVALAGGPVPIARCLADHATGLLSAPESLFAVYRSAA
ncbi:MAG: hypothetical protein B7Z43_07415 [Sphingomonas sp. 12-62-6]|nr:MAG: hypothetical protein B7Z43_07415 [Sphingomonas sp. 12-62-6]